MFDPFIRKTLLVPSGIVLGPKEIILESQALKLRGRYQVQHIRGEEVIGVLDFKNDIVTVGKNGLLDIMFRNQTQIASWYFGLVNNSGWTAFDNADTMSSHSGWTEFTSYDESTRVQWSPAAAASASISNTTVATFSINASGNLKGIFVASNSTKSGTTGTLWSTAAFGSVVPVSNGDQLKVTYTVNA